MQLQMMTFSAIVILLSLATSGQTATIVTPPTAPASLNGLTISTSEKELVPNVTDFISLKCSYLKPNGSDVISVMSMILSRWHGPTETTQELLAVTNVEPSTIIEKVDVGGRVDGHLDQSGESMLSLSWDNPSKQVATRYMCSVSTLDRMGHPVTIQVQTELKMKIVDFSTLVEALREVKDNLEKDKALDLVRDQTLQNITHELEQESTKIEGQEKALQNLTHLLEREKTLNAAQEKELEQQKAVNVAQQKIINELDLFQEYGFKVSGFQIDNQFLYWSSKRLTFQEAKTACTETGGKLAEFEFSTLKGKETYLKEIGMATGYQLWIGLTRSDASSPWVWASSGTQPGSITWNSQPPSDRHCALFYPTLTGYVAYLCTARRPALCSRNV